MHEFFCTATLGLVLVKSKEEGEATVVPLIELHNSNCECKVSVDDIENPNIVYPSIDDIFNKNPVIRNIDTGNYALITGSNVETIHTSLGDYSVGELCHSFTYASNKPIFDWRFNV